MKEICLIDTNIISHTLKKDEGIHKYILSRQTNSLLAITTLTLTEMFYDNDLLEIFCNEFNYIEIAILKPSNLLLKNEIEKFPEELIQNDCILNRFNKDKSGLKSELLDFFKSEIFKSLCIELKTDQRDAVKQLIKLKIDFSDYKIDEFVESYVWTQLGLLEPFFFEKVIKENKLDELIVLKSLYIQAIFIYEKFIIRNNKPSHSDPFDILIISNIPYVNEFITEKTNGGILKNFRDNKYIRKLKVKTMSEIREKK